MTNIPYFTLRDGMSSTLTLNNLAPTPTKATVTIFNSKGRAHVLDPMTLDPHSFKEVRLQDVVPPGDFDSGNIEVAYHGIPMAVTCQVSVFSLERRVSFESREQDMMDFMSSSMNGIAWLPQAEADGFLAVTNAAKTRVSVQLTVGSNKKDISLFPRETQVLKLNEELGLHAPVAALVKLQHNGLPGDIITTGYVLNLKDGYSSSFAMVDPALMRSSHLAGVHPRIGEPGPSEGFPEGTRFHSPLLLANVGDKPVSAHVSVDYTVQERVRMTPWNAKEDSGDKTGEGPTEDKFNTVTVKDLTIASGAVARVELSEPLERLGIGRIDEAGVDVDYDAPPGTLIGHLVSVDQSGDYSFEVPIKDPSEPGLMIESAYPWTIENGTNTVLHLKNTTENSVSALLLFQFPDGGNYHPDRVLLNPYQSIAIDIQKLKGSRKPDVLGHVFPSDVTHGQVYWIQPTPYSMIGRAEETDVKGGTAKSFSCPTDCCDHYSLFAFNLSPSSATGVAGGTQTFTGLESYTDCYGMLWQNVQPDYPASSWTTSASNVVTVSSSGSYSALATYVGGGAATVTGTFPYLSYDTNVYGVCRTIYPHPTSDASAQVTVPTCEISIKFNGSKTAGDNLLFSNAQNTCTESLGPQNCTVQQFWRWSMEGKVVTSNDASRWRINQQLIVDRRAGHYNYAGSLHAFDDLNPIPPGPDGPGVDFFQNTPGTTNLYWIDSPAHYYKYGNIDGVNPINDMIFVLNFTDTATSLDNPNATCTVNWHTKLEVDFAPALNTVSSDSSYGWISTDF